MTGAEGLCGGIATANKNALRACVQLSTERQINLKVLSLHETDKHRPTWLPAEVPFYPYGGNKWRFLGKMLGESLRRPLFICDHVTLALPALPFTAVHWCQTAIVAHGSEADDRMKRTSRWSFRCASRVLTNSELTLRRLKSHLPQVQGESCLLGLSPDIALRQEMFKEGESDRAIAATQSPEPIELEACDAQHRPIGQRMLLLVGRMDETEMEKGHHAIIRALPNLRQQFPDVQAVFPGPGKGRALLADLARQTGVADAVFLPGFVSTEMLDALYKKCSPL
jgi:glycosyltransferase involved in cell wall biosynthesis